MRINLLIAACFLAIIILNRIPIGTTNETIGDYIFIYEIGLLPNTLLFSLICLAILVFIIVLTTQKLNNPLKGQFNIKRKDYHLRTLYINLVIWGAFTLISKLYLSEVFYFFRWTTSYFIVILIMFFAFYLFIKIHIRKATPGFISLDKDRIFLRSFFRIKERELVEMYTIDYDVRRNSIELRFKEGLNNISLPLTDYELNDIFKLIEEIKLIKGSELNITDNFNNTFTKAK